MRPNATLDQTFAGGFVAVGAVDLDEIAEDDVIGTCEPMTRVACVAPGPHDHNAFDVLWQVGVQQPAELRRRIAARFGSVPDRVGPLAHMFRHGYGLSDLRAWRFAELVVGGAR